jgi:hypothetical protein
MKLLGQEEDQVDVRLSIGEIVLLRNTLSEFCHGMNFTESDFQAILDTQKGEAEALLVRLTAAIDRLEFLPD